MSGDLSEKLGQIAHLDQDSANCAEGNLAWLCLKHHSEYDSKTSQHKNYTIGEAKNARDQLYAAIQMLEHLAPPAVRTGGQDADRKTLEDIIQRLSAPVSRLRKWSFNGTSFPFAWFDPLTEFLEKRRGPEFEFVDATLESSRRELIDRLERLEKLVNDIATPIPGQSGWYRIPVEWIDTHPTHYAKMAKRFDVAAKRIYANYDSLVRMARQKLEI